MSQILDLLTYASQNTGQIFLCATTWLLIFLFIFNISSAANKGITTVKRLHQIPCSKCQFFTGNYVLKCPVHPKIALTEEAINCSDYSDYSQSPFNQ